MTKQNSASVTCTTSPMSLQYTEKGFLPLSPPLLPTAVSGYVPTISASAVYPHDGTKAKREQEAMIASTFPASAIGESANQPQRSLTFPISHVATDATEASAWEPISPIRSNTLQANSTKAGPFSLESWETRAGIVHQGNMVKFPKFGNGEEE